VADSLHSSAPAAPTASHDAPLPARRAGLLETARAVLWSFFGVRGRKAHESDLATLNPVVVILMGVALAAAFVVGLIALVRFIVS